MLQVVAHVPHALELVAVGSYPCPVSAPASHRRECFDEFSRRELGGVFCRGIPAFTLIERHTPVTNPMQIDAAIDHRHD